MSCLHPIYAWINGVNPLTNKFNLTFKPDTLWNDDEKMKRQIELPCGRCCECRLEYSRQWADRCVMELEDHDPDSCWFITLTYNDDHIHLCDKYCIDPETGQIVGIAVPMLRPDHLTQFWKDLRREFSDDKIRYFAAGEYGDESNRPHYHAIVYGLHLSWNDPKTGETIDDRKFYKYSRNNDPLWTSKGRLQKCWKYGHIVIGRVTWKSCAYVARYIMKKQKGKNLDELLSRGYVPEFCRMSRKPGLGRGFLERHADEFAQFGEVYTSCNGESILLREPRYSKKLREMSSETSISDKFNGIIDSMERIEDRRSLILSRTDLSEKDYSLLADERATERARRLRRTM